MSISFNGNNPALFQPVPTAQTRTADLQAGPALLPQPLSAAPAQSFAQAGGQQFMMQLMMSLLQLIFSNFFGGNQTAASVPLQSQPAATTATAPASQAFTLVPEFPPPAANQIPVAQPTQTVAAQPTQTIAAQPTQTVVTQPVQTVAAQTAPVTTTPTPVVQTTATQPATTTQTPVTQTAVTQPATTQTATAGQTTATAGTTQVLSTVPLSAEGLPNLSNTKFALETGTTNLPFHYSRPDLVPRTLSYQGNDYTLKGVEGKSIHYVNNSLKLGNRNVYIDFGTDGTKEIATVTSSIGTPTTVTVPGQTVTVPGQTVTNPGTNGYTNGNTGYGYGNYGNTGYNNGYNNGYSYPPTSYTTPPTTYTTPPQVITIPPQPPKTPEFPVTKIRKGSPLILDLNGDGINTTQQNRKFDLFGDGNPVNISSVGKDDAMLVFDGNGDGKLGQSGLEIFGDNTDLNGDGKGDGFANGFDALKGFASKQLGAASVADGKLDAEEIRQLDAKGLKMSVNGEVKSLSEAGITELSLAFTESAQTDAFGNDFRQQSTFTQNGQKKGLIDVWFQPT